MGVECGIQVKDKNADAKIIVVAVVVLLFELFEKEGTGWLSISCPSFYVANQEN